MKKLIFFTCLVTIISCTPKKNVSVWISTADQKQKLTQVEPAAFDGKAEEAKYIITVDEDSVYQEWIGCGACTNDGSLWLMHKYLSKEDKDSLMQNLFDRSKGGIGLDWVRHQMGSGDAAVIRGGWWTYDDMPKGQTDPELKHFSIKDENEYILPVLKEARRLNKDLKIVGCPWTPPVWMKTSSKDTVGHNAYTYGEVKPEFFEAFANYFVKFIKAYEAEGLPVYGISLMNEPLSEPGIVNWQGCKIPAVTETKLIAEYFGPLFEKNNIKTKIYCFDHNWDLGMDYVSTVYNDSAANKYCSGSMWHHYGGSPSVMTEVHQRYPNKEIWFTEGCATSTWVPKGYKDFKTIEGSFDNFSYNVINVPRNWCQTMMMYQIAMDPEHGPAVFAPPTNFGMVTIDTTKKSLEYRPEYYTLGHISKFVVPGAHRIGSNQYDGDIETVAFKNPDSSLILVVAGRSAEAKTIRIKWKTAEMSYIIPARSMVTFVWGK